MNTTIARLGDAERDWLFEDAFIQSVLSREATRILTGAAAGLPEYPTATLDADGFSDLAREVVVTADGALWLYADDLTGSVIAPGSIATCHKCGDRDLIEGTMHVGWRKVVVEFAFCVGCLAGYVAEAERVAAGWGVSAVVVAERGVDHV